MKPNPEHFNIIFWHYPCTFGISAIMDLKAPTKTKVGSELLFTMKTIHLPFEDTIDLKMNAIFKGEKVRAKTKTARESFLKKEIFKETFKLLKDDNREDAMKIFEIEFSANFGKTPWPCHIEDVDSLCRARRAAKKRKGSLHLYILTALWDCLFSHMNTHREREEWLSVHWKDLTCPDGGATRKQIDKLKLPTTAGSYQIKLRKAEKT